MSAKRRTRQSEPSRRQFVQSLVALPLVPALRRAKFTHQAAPQQQTPPPSPSADALLEFVKVRYGKQLSPSQLAEIKQAIDGGLRRAERLRQFKLKNSDEPDVIYNPLT